MTPLDILMWIGIGIAGLVALYLAFHLLTGLIALSVLLFVFLYGLFWDR